MTSSSAPDTFERGMNPSAVSCLYNLPMTVHHGNVYNVEFIDSAR